MRPVTGFADLGYASPQTWLAREPPEIVFQVVLVALRIILQSKVSGFLGSAGHGRVPHYEFDPFGFEMLHFLQRETAGTPHSLTAG